MSDSGRQNATSGDILAEKCDAWIMHLRQCREPDCAECETLFNQLNLAHNVWMRAKSSWGKRDAVHR